MGTDDGVDIDGSDHQDCNGVRFARFGTNLEGDDGEKWRCFSDVMPDLNASSCISEDKSLVDCPSGAKNEGNYCTRHPQLLHMITQYPAKKGKFGEFGIGKEAVSIINNNGFSSSLSPKMGSD